MNSLAEDAVRDISPYDDEGFRQALARVLASPELPAVLATCFPGVPREAILARLRGLTTIEDFQREIIAEALRGMLETTSRGLTVGGLDKLRPGQAHLFLSNHRDILLDSALFTRSLILAGLASPKICLGDNLLVSPFITDLVKMNKGVTVKRGLAQRELLRWSQVLSRLIRAEVESGHDSVWLAQREGRAKDGCDLTHPGVLKMLGLSGEGDFAARLESLHVVPVAISYEYDPCDMQKARERYLLEVEGSYQKKPGEDVASMIAGVRGQKGRIHIEVGREIPKVPAGESKGEQARALCQAIDDQMTTLYRLWPSHYLAFELLEGHNPGPAVPPELRLEFTERLDSRLAGLKLTPAASVHVRRSVLEMYANPVRAAERRARSEAESA
jgi:hypothetical protein